MLMDYLKWEINFRLNEIPDYTIEHAEDLRSLYNHGFHKCTKNGQPIFIQVLAKIGSVDELFALGTEEQLIRYSTKVYYKMSRVVFPICSQAAKTYIHELYTIIDLKNLGKHLLSTKVISLIKGDMTICQNYFPESLGESLIINAGIIFRALWTLIRPFLDDKTKKKVKVLGEDYLEEVLKSVDKENLPKMLGGNCTCGEDGLCLWSDEGLWKDPSKIESLPEEIIKKRVEITNTFIKELKTTADEVENRKKAKGPKIKK